MSAVCFLLTYQMYEACNSHRKHLHERGLKLDEHSETLHKSSRFNCFWFNKRC